MTQGIPFTFATQSGNVPASELDNNFTAVQTSLTTVLQIASAATVDLGSVLSNNIEITGAGTISSFGTTALATQPLFFLTFLGVNTLVYNATSLQLPTAANITTAAGDTAVVWYLGSGNYRVLSYQRKDGSALLAGTSQPPKATYNKLNIQWASNTTVSVSIVEAILEDGSGNTFNAKNVSLTGSVSSNGANGLDTGTVTLNSWYYVYVIYNPTTTTTASLISLSASSPTLPAGYTFLARFGSFRTDGSSTIKGFIQAGPDVQYVVGSNLSNLPIMGQGTYGNIATPTWVSIAVSGFVPPVCNKIKVTAIGGAGNVIVAPNSSYGGRDTTNNNAPLNAAGEASVIAEFLLESTNIYSASNNGATSVLYCMGYTDNL